MKANTKPIFSSLLGGTAAAGTEFLQHLFLPRIFTHLGVVVFHTIAGPGAGSKSEVKRARSASCRSKCFWRSRRNSLTRFLYINGSIRYYQNWTKAMGWFMRCSLRNLCWEDSDSGQTLLPIQSLSMKRQQWEGPLQRVTAKPARPVSLKQQHLDSLLSFSKMNPHAHKWPQKK